MEIFCIFPSGRIARFGNHEGTEQRVAKYAHEHTKIIYFYADAKEVRSS